MGDRRASEEEARLKEREEAKRKAEEAAEKEKQIALEKVRKREAEDALEKYEEKRKTEKEARAKIEETREAARKKAEELRKKEEEEAGRRAREMHRKHALEELQRIKRLSQIAVQDYKKEPENKENIPNPIKEVTSPSENAQSKAEHESKRMSTYNALKSLDDTESIHSKDAEAAATASKKAQEEAVKAKNRVESNVTKSKLSALESDDGSVYYGLGSAARRESKDLDGKVRDSYINDDLADEVEAIRLAADLSSRKLLSEQKRDRRDSVAVSAASASRLRIRALLDKQKTSREDEDRIRMEKRESQDVSKFLWVYR